MTTPQPYLQYLPHGSAIRGHRVGKFYEKDGHTGP